ncbi:hypothetical protein AAG570_006358 [Ranatra chinensis]|uniref:Scavenger receptor class B member 1 n=1 Tax=Ranatra chinensis TaxID=642074 RepID=A0ABD0YTR1_9HEMI
MSAVPVHPLTFVPELSNGTEDDFLMLPNIALLSFAQLLSKSSFLTRMGINMLIKQTNAQPLVNMTAKEFMFGYDSTLVSLGNKFLPSWIKFNKLGLIDRMYDFEGDRSTTFTGTTNIKLSGLLDTYNGLRYLPQWEFPCNNVTGASDGTKFNSLIGKNQTLLFFRKSLCRSMQLIKVGEEMVNGLPGYRYHFKNNSLDNGEFEETNKCFCTDRCLPAGLLDVKACYYGFPIALSYPHFYQSDERLVDDVDGINPSQEAHETYFVINDESGLPLNLSVKMQINMAFGDISGIANVKRFSNKVLPMLWTDITMASLPPSMIRRFYLYLQVGPVVQALATYLFLIGGISFILLSIACALVIPRLSLVSSNKNCDSDWKKGLPASKKHGATLPLSNTKEMELYYCSLLVSPGEVTEDNEDENCGEKANCLSQEDI